MNGFAVVLEEYGSPRARVPASALERALGMTRADASRAAGAAGPFAAEGLGASEAEALRRELAAAGVRSRVVPPESLVGARRPDRAGVVRIAADALHVTLGCAGPVVRVEWDRVALLSAGEVAAPERGPSSGFAGDAAGRGGQREAVVQLADIFARGDDRRLHLRLRSCDLHRGGVPGVHPARGGREGFPGILARIGERASRAAVTPGYRAACVGPEAAGAEPGLWRFGDEERFDRFNRWRFQMLVLGVDVPGPAAGGAALRPPGPPPARDGAGGAAPDPGPGGTDPGPPPAPFAAADPHIRELLELERRVGSWFALGGRALRAAAAAVFVVLLAWSWLRPEGLVPYALLGLALGDMVAMVFVIANPVFDQALGDCQPDGLALEVVAFVFLAGSYWGRSTFASDVDFAAGVFIAAAAAGGGFFARLIAMIAREAREGL